MNQTNKEPQTTTVTVTQAEAKILEDIRRVNYGRVDIYIQEGKPYRKEIVEQQRISPEEGGSAGKFTKKQSSVEIWSCVWLLENVFICCRCHEEKGRQNPRRTGQKTDL